MTYAAHFMYLLGALGEPFAVFQLNCSPEMIYHLASIRLC